jgi:peptide subunit release factor 1 (eRF1)
MTDHELRRALADLSGLRSDEEPIVSLYLDTHWSDEKQRERARVFVQDAAKRAVERHQAHPQLEAMRRTLARVARAAEEQIGQQGEASARGLALFACEALGLWRPMASSRPFKDELCVDGRPHLVQLARLADDVEPAVIAFVHAQGAHFYEVALGDLVNEVTIEGPLPRTHRSGGFQPRPVHQGGVGAGFQYEREQRNQRHQEEAMERNWRAAAQHLERLHERGPRAHIVLVGTGETVAAFERHLPERIRQDILARLPRPPGKECWKGNGKHEIVARVVEKVVEHERAEETKHVEHVVGEALRGGLAVVGPEDVVLAVNERRVHRLILEEDFERSGWRCRNCGALGATHDEVCAFCQGPLARVDALGEELAGRVLAEDGEVEVVAHTNRLHSYGRVAALLRQASPNGLSGARPR